MPPSAQRAAFIYYQVRTSLSRAAALNAAEGLPPLPESLSGILNLSGGSRRDPIYTAEISSRAGGREVLTAKPGGLDAALALLRKEMIRTTWRWVGSPARVGVSPVIISCLTTPSGLTFTFESSADSRDLSTKYVR
uniref:Uncharacterized protein n=1 Tax=Nothobranchius furzeri TaxID=105023 RepID=A0A8C6NPX0_NOTFU